MQSNATRMQGQDSFSRLLGGYLRCPLRAVMRPLHCGFDYLPRVFFNLEQSEFDFCQVLKFLSTYGVFTDIQQIIYY